MRTLARLLLFLSGIGFLAVAPTAALAQGKTAASRGCAGIMVAVGKSGRQCLTPGGGKTQWIKDCPSCPEMVLVPKGRVTLGSPAGEIGRSLQEPPTPVRIAAAFLAGRFAVTFAEWDACVAADGCNGYKPDDSGFGRGNRPVINVSFEDAEAYVRWLSATTGKRYRLLREAEREYVTRAGTTTPFWWGATAEQQQANIDVPLAARRGEAMPVRPGKATVPVDAFAPNAWGFYNVHGNVWEWTADCWTEQGPRRPNERPDAGGGCGQRVARGGSWKDFSAEARSASRMGFEVSSRNNVQGFRVARSLP